MGKLLQPRLEPDVAKMVVTVATRNSRSIPAEVNHVLREHYTGHRFPLRGIGPNGEGGPFTYTTILDPTERLVDSKDAKEKRRTNARG